MEFLFCAFATSEILLFPCAIDKSHQYLLKVTVMHELPHISILPGKIFSPMCCL